MWISGLESGQMSRSQSPERSPEELAASTVCANLHAKVSRSRCGIPIKEGACRSCPWSVVRASQSGAARPDCSASTKPNIFNGGGGGVKGLSVLCVSASNATYTSGSRSVANCSMFSHKVSRRLKTHMESYGSFDGVDVTAMGEVVLSYLLDYQVLN